MFSDEVNALARYLNYLRAKFYAFGLRARYLAFGSRIVRPKEQMMKRLTAVILATAVLFAAGCAGNADPGAATATAPSAKLSPDLFAAVAAGGRIDVLVQVDPQIIYRQVVGERDARLQADQAVIWKAREEGAVIWKFTPEQAVIWKMTTDRAVIWKFVEKLTAAGYTPAETFESIHTVKILADEATVTALAAMDEVSYITPDRAVGVAGLDLTNLTLGLGDVTHRVNATNFTGLTGNGVGVAVIDSGINAGQGDFGSSAGSRIVASQNFSGEGAANNVADGYGHGTHVAGLAAGNGRMSFINGYNTTFEGAAPKANLIVAKALNSQGSGTVSGVIAALQWVLSIKKQYNIRVVNLSLGLPPVDPWASDPLCEAVQNAVNNGLVVVAAAGNYGYYNGQTLYGSIASPGITPGAVTVGASDSRGTPQRQRDANGNNDDVAYFSSRGPTAWDGLAKPDLVSPGVNIVSALAPGSALATAYPQNIVNACTFGGSPCGAANASYFAMSGTSMATPLVAGVAALLLEANPSLTPNSVKAILMMTAEALYPNNAPAACYANVNWRNNPACAPVPAIDEGSGLLNAPGAAALAAAVSPATAGLKVNSPWLVNKTIQPATAISSLNENVVWSQGLAWTGLTPSGTNLYNVFQPAYAGNVIWSQGLAWTGVTTGPDPVFTPVVVNIWSGSFVNPMSISGTDAVLGGYSYDWSETPELSSKTDAWFPES